MQALNSGLFLVVNSEVENLGYSAVCPGLNPGLDAGDFLGQGSGVLGDRQPDNMGPSLFGDKVGIRIAGTESTDLEDRQALLFEVKLQGVNRIVDGR